MLNMNHQVGIPPNYLEKQKKMADNVDCRGTPRGGCSSCACAGYSGGSEKKKCTGCGHPPGKHQNLSASSKTSVSSSSSGVSSISSPFSPPATGSAASFDGGASQRDSAIFMSPDPVLFQCGFPGCQMEADFDPNTGVQKPYCPQHTVYAQLQQQSGQSGNDSFTTPRIQWSLGNADSSDFASSQSDSSDDEQYQSSSASNRVQSDAERPKSAVMPPTSSVPWAMGGLASVFNTFFQSRKQRVNDMTKPQLASPQKSTQSLGVPTPAVARPATTPLLQAHQPIPSPSLNLQDQQICKLPGCSRPRYVEQGKMHDFCGRRHAQQYQQQCAPQIPQNLQCATPGCTKQKYRNEQGGYFDYCSKYCRDHGLTSASTADLQMTSYGTCSLPGCMRPKYRDPANGRIHDYCGRTHASQARAQGLQPNPSMVRQANQQEFTRVSQQFTKDWNQRKGPCPSVNFIFIVSNLALENRWSAYKQTLSDQTVEEYYHGTKLNCNLSNAPCTDTECGICGISNMGLDRRCIRKNINFQRFGHGFYLAPNSSKCHDYTQGANGYRAMLLCAVCPGRKYTLQTDHVSLKGPPQGYDCVFGKEGSSLNYAEIVVYNPDAVVPRYIIVYQKDGVHKIAK